MKKRAYYILAVVFGIILLSIVIVMLSGEGPVLYCSPNSPRVSGVAKWEETISPVQEGGQLDEDFFDRFVVDSNNNSLTFQRPSNNAPENSFAFELAELAPGEDLKIGGGSLELSAIGAAYLDANQVLEDDAKYRYYNSGLQSISDEEVSKLGNYNLIENGGSFRHSPFPAVRFGFVSRDVEDLMYHGIKIFDARTRKSLISGYSSSGSGEDDYLWFKTHIPFWHRGAIDLVLDVSYGPMKTFEFAPRAGEGFDAGRFKCRLIHVFEGVDVRQYESSSHDSMVTHQFFKAPPDRAGTCFFFVCWPQAHQMPVTFEFLDKDGNILRGRGRSTSGYIQKNSLEHPLEKVALIRARYRTRRQRVVIHLPYIPGLPEKNNAIDNLFDVHIPYVRLQDAGHVGRFLRQTLQLRNSRSTGRTPPNSINNTAFPLDFSDVTVRQIAEHYAQGGSLHIDLENENLILEYPLTLLERLGQYLEKLFR
jgi:hypothetical protein